MRFDRVVVPCLLFALAGCVTTHTNTGALGKPLPQESKAQQATDAARIHTELGQHYLATGDLQTALTKVQMALQFDPNYAPAYFNLGLLLERRSAGKDRAGAAAAYARGCALGHQKSCALARR